MEFIIHGRKVEVTEPIKKYIEEKIGRLDKYFEDPSNITATVVVKIRGKEQIVEVTIPLKRVLLRCEESHDDLYAAIDIVSDKIERQIRKNKTRMSRKYKDEGIGVNFDLVEAPKEEEDKTIVKRKQIEMKPMSEEEAILQMELLGHEFFVFKNIDSDEVDVLYRRKDGDYGIIETK
ncbi:MAG: ribosome-associated translation inhibitor RaiA [Bacilli bacterium]|nr:ribosome-associated translation inhibitor RaiA [Bacilli bacterium]